LRLLLSNVVCGVQRFMPHHAAITPTLAPAMASPRASRYVIRAYLDELDKKIAFDKAELDQLERKYVADKKFFIDRIERNRAAMRECLGRPLEQDTASSASQTTLSAKRAKLIAVRAVGVQTD